MTRVDRLIIDVMSREGPVKVKKSSRWNAAQIMTRRMLEVRAFQHTGGEARQRRTTPNSSPLMRVSTRYSTGSMSISWIPEDFAVSGPSRSTGDASLNPLARRMAPPQTNSKPKMATAYQWRPTRR